MQGGVGAARRALQQQETSRLISGETRDLPQQPRISYSRLAFQHQGRTATVYGLPPQGHDLCEWLIASNQSGVGAAKGGEPVDLGAPAIRSPDMLGRRKALQRNFAKIGEAV